ncbi:MULTISPECIES: class I SAM-dependent methyltransferase [Virgibacillus]|uniref:class I SAM-dependent methyltransferase n=1 Tax=Virgibacillus TaxID=84406 RepID=UPI0017E887BA|nr:MULTISPECIES: class I SAM-dependent methyltransferase [Virgibacillus]MBU5265965.1 class I SAM-dependent methyltransferase [Virgibacillus proomii]NWO15092.1 class I SAM-dependent methyltransferase [Virgibacillus sp.]
MQIVDNNLFTKEYHQAYDYSSYYTGRKILDILYHVNLILGQKTSFTREEVYNNTECMPNFIPSVNWALDFLIQEGFIERKKNKFVLINQRDSPKMPMVDLDVSYKMIDYVSENWLNVIKGNISPIKLFLGKDGKRLWKEYFGENNYLYYVHNAWIASFLTKQKSLSDKEILELGAGFGSGTKAITRDIVDKRYKNIQYYATDISRVMCKYIKNEIPYKDLNTLVLNFEKEISLQVSNKKFDYIVAINALHCSNDILYTLNSIKNSLKSGGSLIISECIRDNTYPLMHQEFIFNLLPGYTQKKSNKYYIKGFYYEKEWLNAFEESGFYGIEIYSNPGNRKLGAILKGMKLS